MKTATDCRQCKDFEPPTFHGRGYCLVREQDIKNPTAGRCKYYNGPRPDEDVDREEDE